MRKWLVFSLAGLALAGCGSETPKSAGKPDAGALAGAPAPLAALHERDSQLVGGGPQGFKRQLRQVRGYAVVVNKWASWCGPCRAEFPFFQRQSVKRGKRIAFLGVNSNDADKDARDFLADFPVPYPSFKDPNLGIAAVFNGVQGFPTTAYYDSKGELAYVHQGAYASERALAEDIERYAR